MIEAVVPQMKMILPKLSDQEVAELAGWAGSLELRHIGDAPNFAEWAGTVIGEEIVRRSSGGAVEAGSQSLPPMGPKEVGTVLMILSARTYCPQTERIGQWFDETLKHVIALAAIQLSEFETLCQAINEQAESEE